MNTRTVEIAKIVVMENGELGTIKTGRKEVEYEVYCECCGTHLGWSDNPFLAYCSACE